MAVRIRLARMGRTNRAFFRIGVFDAHTRRNGRAIEFIGYYDPVNLKAGTTVKADRLQYWLSKGALPTQTVGQIMERLGQALPQPTKRASGKKRRRAHSKLKRKAARAPRPAAKPAAPPAAS